MSAPLQRIGVIGAGRWGANIIKTLARLGYLAGVADTSSDRLAVVAAGHPGTPTYQSLAELLDSGVTGVAVATPVSTHFELARESLLRGVDTFVEKPLAMNAADARALAALAKAEERVLMTGHLLLYHPAIIALKEALESGILGRVVSFYQVRRNLGTVRLAENALQSLGVHDVAVLTYLIGRLPDRVNAVGQSVLNKGIEDEVSVRLRYDQPNVSAQLDVSWLWPYKERRLVVVAERGFYVYDEIAQRLVLTHSYATADGKTHPGAEELIDIPQGDPLANELEHFVSCIRDRILPRSGPEHSVAVVTILDRVQQILNNNETEEGNFTNG